MRAAMVRRPRNHLCPSALCCHLEKVGKNPSELIPEPERVRMPDRAMNNQEKSPPGLLWPEIDIAKIKIAYTRRAARV